MRMIFSEKGNIDTLGVGLGRNIIKFNGTRNGLTNRMIAYTALWLSSNRDRQAFVGTINNIRARRQFRNEFPHLNVKIVEHGLTVTFPACDK